MSAGERVMGEKLTRNISFGWGAPPFAEQLPELDPKDAAAFDEDNRAIIRLHVRGLLATCERNKAIKRATDAIAANLAGLAALSEKGRE